jgi:hypothetical protein
VASFEIMFQHSPTEKKGNHKKLLAKAVIRRDPEWTPSKRKCTQPLPLTTFPFKISRTGNLKVGGN